MIVVERFTLVDPDPVRRGEVAERIEKLGARVAAFVATDVVDGLPEEGYLLVHDSGTQVESFLDRMAETARWLPTIGYAANARPERVVDLVSRGAVDFLAWPFSAARLSKRLLALETGQRSLAVFHRRAIRARALIEHLSPRQRDVLYGVANGGTNKHIARDLHLSPRTVEIHRANMMHRLGARTPQEAVTIALFAALRNDPETTDRFEPQLLSE
jgi:two-component system response regulator FixJ